MKYALSVLVSNYQKKRKKGIYSYIHGFSTCVLDQIALFLFNR